MITKGNIAGIDSEEMTALCELFEKEQSIEQVILYGSRAMGSHHAGSDIDLTLRGVALTTSWLMDLSVKVDDLLLPYEVDLSIFDHIENPELVEHIQRVGKVVYQK